MADAAAVQFLLDNIGQLLMHHLTGDARNEVEKLTSDLEYFNAFLRYASKRKLTDKRELESMRQIRDVVYDAEDVLDAYVTQTTSSKSKRWFKRIYDNSIKLDAISQRVRTVRKNTERAYGDLWNLDTLSSEIREQGLTEEVRPREMNVVGLEEDKNKIIEYLKEDTPRLDIISIVGMPGLGKSTLARKILQDPMIQYEFPTRIWVYVSKFTPKDVFLSILREFTSLTEEVRIMTERELAAQVKVHLERGKFLIVMDNVWSPEDWTKISAALPATNHQGKILITSRYENVALYANRNRQPYHLRFLRHKESVMLLQYEVFGEPNWPAPEFEELGELLAIKCNGLPLAIVVIGGIVGRKLSTISNPAAKLNAWKKVAERVSEYLHDDPARTMDKTFSLSYDTLPYHLRACLLYFGMFPSDIEIPTRKLFSMWIAEGFVHETTSFTQEEIAESYLDELITRNLVAVDRRNSDGRVKTCRIHYFLWDFCKKQAGWANENFFEEIRKSRDGSLTPVVNDDLIYRRLCIHSNISEFIASKPSGRRVRSFVCFSKEDITLKPEQASAIPEGFKLLRVLDVKPLRFSKIPSDMFDLLHLRFIHLSFTWKVLPRGFSKLWNIQTLIVETSEPTLEINADIWKMRHLRHVKTNAITTLPEPTDTTTALDANNIQTLGTISPENCTDKVIHRACNVRRLNIRGKLEMLLSSGGKQGSFDNIVKLEKLEKLKLQNDVFPRTTSEGPLPLLPPSEKFPPNMRILTLSSTFLDWSQMEVLGSLEKLEVLKLKEEAFKGNYWETADVGFQRLKVLFIGRTDLAVWKMSAGTIFPNLMHLELQNCNDLREVPIKFAQNPSLSVLILNHCRTAANSAKEIKKLKMEAKPSVEFKLSLFPPID